jgi:hypothetical protein
MSGVELKRSACAASARNFSFSSFSVSADFFSMKNFGFRGRSKASDWPSAFTLLMEDTSSRERKPSRSFGFSSPTISIDW